MASSALALWLCADLSDDDATGVVPHESDPAPQIRSAFLPDADRIARIRAGDVGEFESVYRANIASLIGFAAAITGDEDGARDIVADVFLEIWRQRAGFEAPIGIRPYLYVAVRHRALNALRARGRANRWASVLSGDLIAMSVPPVAPDEQLEGEERIVAVRQALDTLPEPRRTICRLRFQEGMGFEEIGIALGISPNAVQQHLSRTRKLLRELLPAAFR